MDGVDHPRAVFICTPVSRLTLTPPPSLSLPLSLSQVDFQREGSVGPGFIFLYFFFFSGKVQIEPDGNGEQGAAISHDRSMVGLTTGQGARASHNLLIESQCHC